jgi:WD40 repeat protein
MVATAVGLGRAIQIWDAASGQLIREVGVEVARSSIPFPALAFSPSGKFLATRQTADSTRVWEVATGRQMATIPTESGATATSPMAFSPDDKVLVVSSRRATRAQTSASAHVWNLERRAKVTELRGFLSTVLSLSFSADGRTILSASGDKFARVWNARTGQVLKEFPSETEAIDFATLSPHGEVLLTVASGHSARLWETSTRTLLSEIHGLRTDLVRATFGPDGRIVVVERGGTVRFVDCDVCGGPRELLANAAARLKRADARPAEIAATGRPPAR